MRSNWKLSLGLGLCAVLILVRLYVFLKAPHAPPPTQPSISADQLIQEMKKAKLSLNEPPQVDRIKASPHPARRVAPLSLLLSISSGAFLRLGLESTITWGTARKLVAKLESKDPLTMDESLGITLQACAKEAANKAPAEDHIHLIAPKEEVYLTCAPKESCLNLDTVVGLKLHHALQADELKLGELYDVAWPEALCKLAVAKGPAQPFAISEAFVLRN